MDDAERQVHADIATYGWHTVNVFADAENPGFQYSIGFKRSFDHPEILIFGQRSEVMHAMLTRIAEGLRAGRRYDAGEPATDILDGFECVFRPIPRDQLPEFFGWAIWYYGEGAFAGLQCIWPDKHGRYPWHPDAADELRRREPILHPG